MDNKKWYEKVGIWIGIISGIFVILGISVSGILSNDAKNNSTNVEGNEIEMGDQSQIIIGDNNNVSLNGTEKNEYEKMIAQADYEYNNENYLDAASLYDKAYSVAYDDEKEFEALYDEAACYFQLAIQTQEDIYISNFIRLFDMVLNPKYEKYERHKNIPVDICFFFSCIRKSQYNIDLSSYITELENTYNFSDLNEISEADAYFMHRVAIVLGMYYEDQAKAIEEKRNSDIYREYVDKAFFYYDMACVLSEQVDMYDYKRPSYPLLYPIIAEFMVDSAYYLYDGSDGYSKFDEAIQFCKSVINCLDISDRDDSTFFTYVRMTTIMGEAYIDSGIFIDEDYFDNAYDVLCPLLNIRSQDIEIELALIEIGGYLVLSRKCTNDDIKVILDRYEAMIEQLSSSNNLSEYIRVMKLTCAACDGIILYYEDSERAQDLKDKYSKEIEKLSISLE